MKKLAIAEQALLVSALDNGRDGLSKRLIVAGFRSSEVQVTQTLKQLADSMRDSTVGIWITSEQESALLVDATTDVTESEASGKDFKINAAEMIYDREASLRLRAEIIRLRNNYLANNMFSEAVILSHATAWMHAMMDAVSV